MNLPNTISLLRIVLIPCFGLLWWRGSHGAALVVFAVAGLSDLLDGFLARLLHQQSRLGQILDPAADKFMLLVSFLVAAALHVVPRWLAALVIGRDVILVLGSGLFIFVLRGRYAIERWKPTRIGKYSTFAQVLTIGLGLLERTLSSLTLRPYVGAFAVLCGVLTACSGTQYIVFGARALGRGKLAEGGRA